jgi:hypothetical protein
MQSKKRKGAAALVAIPVLGLPTLAMAQTQTIRIANYNIEADIDNVTQPLPGLYQVLEGIGEEDVSNDVQPVDILALEETTSNGTVGATTSTSTGTVGPIVAALNNFYSGTTTNSYTGASSVHPVYAMSTYQATDSGGSNDGNGPNALIYNTSALNLLASVGVGTPTGSTTSGGNGEYRQVVRYEFQPVSDTGTNGVFYVYVCHAKSLSSGTLANDQADQKAEATIIRNNEATLPANASVLYVGDWNVNGSTDPSVVEMTSAGQGQATDALNPTNASESWATNATYQNLLTESATDLAYRDDIQFMTSNVYNGTPGSLSYVNGSAHAFGNNGTTAEGHSVNDGTDTALNSDLYEDGSSFISASSLYGYLTTGSDHLPVVGDYTIAIPEPASLGIFMFAGSALFMRPRRSARRS